MSGRARNGTAVAPFRATVPFRVDAEMVPFRVDAVHARALSETGDGLGRGIGLWR